MRLLTRMTQILIALGAPASLMVSPASAGIWGSPKFTMSQSDDRFSADDLTHYSSDGNRISKKSVAGGIHIDKKGVFLNPAAAVNQKTNRLELLTLSLINETERTSTLGTPNAIGRPLRVSFITGEGTPIVLEFTRGEQIYGEAYCDRVTSQCTTSLSELGVTTISVEQYRRLMAASALAIKVEGTDRSRIYEARDIAPTFIPNLATFYNTYVANTQ